MTASPIDWEALENALRDWAAEALEISEASGERVIWADPNAPQVPRPFATLAIVAGPTPLGRHDHRTALQTMRDRVAVTGAGAVTLRIHGVDPEDAESYAGRTYAAGPGASATAVRNDLVAALAAEPGVTASADGVANLLVAGTAGRRRFHLVVESGPATRETELEAVVETIYTPTEITVRVQVEAATQQPSGHARSYAARLVASLGDPTIRRDLRAAGLYWMRAAAPQDLTALIGDQHVSRVAQDFFFGVDAHHDRQVPWARTAAVTGTTTA